MDTHLGMQQQTGTTFALLFIGGAILLLAIISYWYAAKLNKDNTSRLKKEEKAGLRKKSKTMRLAGHSLLGLSILLMVIFSAQYFGSAYDVAELNRDLTLEVTDDKYYGADHTDDPVQYEMSIPTSGAHSPHDLKFGFYTEKPPYEKLVHNLEHGDIIIYYHADADKDMIDLVKYLANFREAGAGVLAVPNEDIPAGKEMVVTAWTKTMELTEFDQQKIGQFIYDHINKGPEQIPATIRRGGGTM